jgi:hypothetical protein
VNHGRREAIASCKVVSKARSRAVSAASIDTVRPASSSMRMPSSSVSTRNTRRSGSTITCWNNAAPRTSAAWSG